MQDDLPDMKEPFVFQGNVTQQFLIKHEKFLVKKTLLQLWDMGNHLGVKMKVLKEQFDALSKKQ